MCRAKAPIAFRSAEPGTPQSLRPVPDIFTDYQGVSTSSMLALHMASVYGAADFDMEARVRALRRQAERREMVRQLLIQYREVQDFYRERITQERDDINMGEMEAHNAQVRNRSNSLPGASTHPRRRPSLVRRMLKAASQTFHELGEGLNDLFGEDELSVVTRVDSSRRRAVSVAL